MTAASTIRGPGYRRRGGAAPRGRWRHRLLLLLVASQLLYGISIYSPVSSLYTTSFS